jgi:hypothetical protein
MQYSYISHFPLISHYLQAISRAWGIIQIHRKFLDWLQDRDQLVHQNRCRLHPTTVTILLLQNTFNISNQVLHSLIIEFLTNYMVKVKVTLGPTVSWPVCLGIKHSPGAYDQIFITLRQLWICQFRALSLTRGWVCRLQLLLVLASTVILGSESRGTGNHILLSQIRDFPFRHLLRLAGLWWRHSTPPPHEITWYSASSG